jgi:hypothetical protein
VMAFFASKLFNLYLALGSRSNELFLPKEVLLAHLAESHPSPMEVIAKIAAMFLDSTHRREQSSRATA